MKKHIPLFFLLFLLKQLTYAQTKQIQPYGQVTMDDLLLKDCDFEKGANAMVLFDLGSAKTSVEGIDTHIYKRVKIFSIAGKKQGNIRLVFNSDQGIIKDIEAQTVNLEGGQVVTTKVDPKLMFTETIDQYHKAIVFAFENIKPGCVIEYRYHRHTDNPNDFRTWYFQEKIPVKYSELDAIISYGTKYNLISKGYQPFTRDTSIVLGNILGKPDRECIWAKANVHSYINEPFVTPGVENEQSIGFQLNFLSAGMDFVAVKDSWERVARKIMYEPYFGMQLNEGLSGQDTLIKHAKSLATDDEKIAYLFGQVKKNMAWNKFNHWATDKGVKYAWNKKEGNSAEINLILFNLLKRSGITVYPMLVSTRNNGVINPTRGSFWDTNVTVDYVPTADTTKYYVLDASNKYNVYNDVPAEFLNTYGIMITPPSLNKMAKAIYLKNETPAKQIVIIDGAIGADSKVSGIVNIASYSYNKAKYSQLHDKLDGQQYIDYLIDNDNNLKIEKPVFENLGIDSLPLMQKFNFALELTATDGDYIYFTPNVFTPLRSNPFLSETRYSDIDFDHCNAYSINGTYKLPAGYKINALPKSQIMNMPDKSIVFKRVIGELNGSLQVHYNITYTRSIYNVGEYRAIREFYKKMYDMLNEPIVLKKGG